MRLLLLLLLLFAVFDAKAATASRVGTARRAAPLAPSMRVADTSRLGAHCAVGHCTATAAAVRDAEPAAVGALLASRHLAKVAAAVFHAQAFAPRVFMAAIATALRDRSVAAHAAGRQGRTCHDAGSLAQGRRQVGRLLGKGRRPFRERQRCWGRRVQGAAVARVPRHAEGRTDLRCCLCLCGYDRL